MAKLGGHDQMKVDKSQIKPKGMKIYYVGWKVYLIRKEKKVCFNEAEVPKL